MLPRGWNGETCQIILSTLSRAWWRIPQTSITPCAQLVSSFFSSASVERRLKFTNAQATLLPRVLYFSLSPPLFSPTHASLFPLACASSATFALGGKRRVSGVFLLFFPAKPAFCVISLYAPCQPWSSPCSEHSLWCFRSLSLCIRSLSLLSSCFAAASASGTPATQPFA